jgi:hypothetical protein
VDKEKEALYWAKIREAQDQMEYIKRKPAPRNITTVDYNKVRDFLKGLARNWQAYSLTSRNQLLKLIIESVELRGYRDIEATIIWKIGFKQKIIIHRPASNRKLEKRWTEEEERLHRMMYPSSSPDALMVAIPNRTWKGITSRAERLKLYGARSRGDCFRKWTQKEDEQLGQLCKNRAKYEEIACELGRSVISVKTRVREKGLGAGCPNGIRKSRSNWDSLDLTSSQESSTEG